MSAILKEIDNRINALWTKEKFNDAYTIIVQELVPILCDSLAGKGCNQQDAEDIVAEALRSFSKKISIEGPKSIAAPKPFLWTAVEWRMKDNWSKNKKNALSESQISPANADLPLAPHEHLDNEFNSGKGSHLIPIWQKRATYMVEGLFEDVEVSESDAARLIREALKFLSENNKQIINHLLDYGTDQASADAAAQLKITAGNFRVRKLRAYDEFRNCIQQVRTELRIEWRGLAEEVMGTETVHFYPLDGEDNSTEAGKNGL
jgi:DNA-directed RNA polymerase specialized sigma24 family protein